MLITQSGYLISLRNCFQLNLGMRLSFFYAFHLYAKIIILYFTLQTGDSQENAIEN